MFLEHSKNLLFHGTPPAFHLLFYCQDQPEEINVLIIMKEQSKYLVTSIYHHLFTFSYQKFFTSSNIQTERSSVVK